MVVIAVIIGRRLCDENEWKWLATAWYKYEFGGDVEEWKDLMDSDTLLVIVASVLEPCSDNSNRQRKSPDCISRL